MVLDQGSFTCDPGDEGSNKNRLVGKVGSFVLGRDVNAVHQALSQGQDLQREKVSLPGGADGQRANSLAWHAHVPPPHTQTQSPLPHFGMFAGSIQDWTLGAGRCLFVATLSAFQGTLQSEPGTRTAKPWISARTACGRLVAPAASR